KIRKMIRIISGKKGLCKTKHQYMKAYQNQEVYSLSTTYIPSNNGFLIRQYSQFLSVSLQKSAIQKKRFFSRNKGFSATHIYECAYLHSVAPAPFSSLTLNNSWLVKTGS